MRWNSQLEEWGYSVQFGSQIRFVPESVLQPFEAVQTPWEALRSNRLSGIRHFIVALTFHRLRSPPARIAHSFATARTVFYPHQFKPLLKFLDNPGKRLLIADDVGLGKTIEAGYILRELEAHEDVERVLIIVPARLQTKWKRELQNRFNETFEIVKGNELIKQAERLRRGKEVEPFRWITSYESARPDEVSSALDETKLPIDVLIFDEAHRMRNPDTLQHTLGTKLCEGSADSVILLSATPVQNRLEDLWHILRMLSPLEFDNWPVFADQMQSNRHVITAQAALARAPADFQAARSALSLFFQSRAGTLLESSVYGQSIMERLDGDARGRAEVVELQADIGRLSPIAHIICRTRKPEAVTSRAVRDARWMRVLLRQDERDIYQSIQGLCRTAYSSSGDSWGFQMSLMMAYRITASCIPAAMLYFAERLGANLGPSLLNDEVEEGEAVGADSEAYMIWPQEVRDTLLQVVAQYRISAKHDSKLIEFVNALLLIWADDDQHGRPRRKIVVFSFFRRTLQYLTRQLTARDVPNRMIHGGIPLADREVAIDDFLDNPEVRVLLTSEVGGEGLDLQRACVVINYDLPWNPMVVEQRIGRVDRIGQESDRIVILNLVVEDSIEERVIQRLLEKIDIFRTSIGEMDDIVGEEIERITGQALRGELSDLELKRVVEERGNAIAIRLHEAKQMLSKVDHLLASDQGLIDEINQVIGERQIPAERELLCFLNQFLAGRFPGCQLPPDVERKVVSLDLQPLAQSLEAAAQSLGVDALSLARRVNSGLIPITLSREAGYNHPRAELIHLNHPLTRFAIAELQASGERPCAAFQLKLESSSILTPGRYAFLIASVQIKGERPRTKLAAVFVSREDHRLWTDSSDTIPVMIEILEDGRDCEAEAPLSSEVGVIEGRLMEGLEQLKAEWEGREQKLDQARREHQIASRRATLEFLVARAKNRLVGLEARAGDFAVRMARARVAKAQRDLDGLLATQTPTQWEALEHEEIAVGLLEVSEWH
jgi:superfamily II DNA or RNA helicase